MKTSSWMTFVVLVCLALTIFACSRSPTEGSPSSLTPSPSVRAPAQDPATVTAAPVFESPTHTTNTASVASELSQDEILQIVRSSLAAYPWRLKQSVLVKGTQRTITSLTEVQSSTRGYNQSVQTIGDEAITIESILIDPMLYLKITGSLAETYGLIDGQWTELPPDSPLAQLADTSTVDPAKIAEIFATDFAAMSGQSGVDELFFQQVGSEDMNGISTNIYESKSETITYRWWVSPDGRFYKSTVDTPEATRMILVEYDPSIAVEPPIP